MGYSSQQFYEIRRNFQTYSAEGLLDRIPGTATQPLAQVRQGRHPRLLARGSFVDGDVHGEAQQDGSLPEGRDQHFLCRVVCLRLALLAEPGQATDPVVLLESDGWAWGGDISLRPSSAR